MNNTYGSYKKKRALATIAIIVIAGLFLGGYYLYEEYSESQSRSRGSKSRAKQAQIIIDNPDGVSYLRLISGNTITVFQAQKWSADSIEFKVGHPAPDARPGVRKMSKMEYYEATKQSGETFKMAKADLKRAISGERQESTSVVVNGYNNGKPFYIYEGVRFNGAAFLIRGYSFARNDKPARITIKNTGLPVVIESLKSIDGVATLLAGNGPLSLDAGEVFKVDIDTASEGDRQTFEFEAYVITETGIKSIFKFKREGKTNECTYVGDY